MFKSVAKISAVILALGIVAYVSRWMTLGPEANCKSAPVAESFAADHAYKVTVLMKDCNLSESIFYSVRVDALSPPLQQGWFTVRELENDTRPEAPKVDWSTTRRLEIVSKTRTLGGQLSEHAGDDLTIVRTFLPSNPDAFPNY